MSLPFELTSRILLGVRFGRVIRYPPAVVSQFFDVWSADGDASTFGQALDGLRSRFTWTSRDGLSSADFEHSDMRIEVRSPVPYGVYTAAPAGTSWPDGMHAVSFQQMLESLKNLAVHKLPLALNAVGALDVRRVGAVIELEVPHDVLVHLVGAGPRLLAGHSIEAVESCLFEQRVDLGTIDGTGRSLITSYKAVEIDAGQESRFHPPHQSTVKVLACDYQEVFAEPIQVARSRDERRRSGDLVAVATERVLRNAREVWHDLYRNN